MRINQQRGDWCSQTPSRHEGYHPRSHGQYPKAIEAESSRSLQIEDLWTARMDQDRQNTTTFHEYSTSISILPMLLEQQARLQTRAVPGRTARLWGALVDHVLVQALSVVST